MLDLKSFHMFFIWLAIVVTAGVGVWGLLNGYPVLGVISLVAGVALILYSAMFARRAQRV
jgi:membrane protein implicated in regulation of membrane protease activity